MAVPSYNSQTAEAAKTSTKVIETEGQGYHADLRQAILNLNLTYPVLTISSVLPLLNGEFLDEIIDKYEKSRKPSLTDAPSGFLPKRLSFHKYMKPHA